MSLRVVFMGTPDFAAASLAALLDAPDMEVAAVFTQPDKPKGRGMKLAPSPVKELALERGIAVYQPAGVRGEDALELMRSLAPDVLAVVAYGKLLPDALLAVPRLGAVNVHGSLLPRYRGAAPIQWAVLNGDRETGVTTMYLAHDMDAGDVIYQERTPVGEFETAGELFDRLAGMGAQRLVMVSCNSATLARDLAILSQLGYRPIKARPVDMFPRTNHVETVVLLSKGQG